MEKLAQRLKEVLQELENNVSKSEVVEKLKSVIDAVEQSQCSNGVFCGMEKKCEKYINSVCIRNRDTR